MSALTILDFLIIGGLAIGIWRGTRTGAVRQVVGLLGIVAAVWFGALLMVPTGAALVTMTGLPRELAPLVGFLSVAVLVLIAAAAIALIMRATLSALKLGIVDRGVGGLFGGARMAVVISLVLLLSAGPALPGSGGLLFGEDTREQSILYAPVRAVAPILWEGVRAAAPDWQETLMDKFEAHTRGEGPLHEATVREDAD